MLWIELINAASDGISTTRIEKQFENIADFSYFYECAKLDGWQFINVRMYDPNRDDALAASRTMDLLNRARLV
jgi:hypothetical protein